MNKKLSPHVQKNSTKALQNFQKQYPSVTSADLQAFILGYNACLETNQFTNEEIKRLLLTLIMFSSANENQGLKALINKPVTFGELTDHAMLVLFELSFNDGEKTTLDIIHQLRDYKKVTK